MQFNSFYQRITTWFEDVFSNRVFVLIKTRCRFIFLFYDSNKRLPAAT
jgi:hypothetical protein